MNGEMLHILKKAGKLQQIHVDLGKNSYTIYIGSGSLSTLGSILKRHLPLPRLTLVTNDTINILYGDIVRRSLQAAGMEVEIYPDQVKLSKQFKNADRREIKLDIVAGPDEMAERKVKSKDMMSGKERKIEREKVVAECKAMF